MMERNIRLLLEYEGTAYRGWQYQNDLPTVQGCLEEAIFRLTDERVRVTAAGRTDAGVHARGQVVNFMIRKPLPLYSIEMGLNYHLPDDIVVNAVTEAPADFNARFQARQRIYQYYISTRRTALNRAFCWQFFQTFDPAVLPLLAEMLLGDHDFGSFSRLEVQSVHKRCIVYESRWLQPKPHLWVYRIAANRFLHGMVRTIVGTMIDVARGRFSVAQFRDIFAAQDRLSAGPAAPAKGLVLEAVAY